MDKHFDKIRERNRNDKRRYEKLDSDECQLCEAYGNDKRSLYIKCFYDVSEAVPEMISLQDVEEINIAMSNFFYLRICKSCRGSLLGHLREWAASRRTLRGIPKDHDGGVEPEYEDCDEEGNPRNIPYRKDGRTIMISEEEWRVKHGYETD
jgi:hypothetical protein